MYIYIYLYIYIHIKALVLIYIYRYIYIHIYVYIYIYVCIYIIYLSIYLYIYIPPTYPAAHRRFRRLRCRKHILAMRAWTQKFCCVTWECHEWEKVAFMMLKSWYVACAWLVNLCLVSRHTAFSFTQPCWECVCKHASQETYVSETQRHQTLCTIDERRHYLIARRHGRPPQVFGHCHMWWVISLPSVCIARTNTHPGSVCNTASSNALYDRATWPFSSIITTSYVSVLLAISRFFFLTRNESRTAVLLELTSLCTDKHLHNGCR
jgi:hypothetical protein